MWPRLFWADLGNGYKAIALDNTYNSYHWDMWGLVCTFHAECQKPYNHSPLRTLYNYGLTTLSWDEAARNISCSPLTSWTPCCIGWSDSEVVPQAASYAYTGSITGNWCIVWSTCSGCLQSVPTNAFPKPCWLVPCEGDCVRVAVRAEVLTWIYTDINWVGNCKGIYIHAYI